MMIEPFPKPAPLPDFSLLESLPGYWRGRAMARAVFASEADNDFERRGHLAGMETYAGRARELGELKRGDTA